MRILQALGIIFYSAVIIVVGILLIVFALNILQPQDLNNLIARFQANLQSRTAFGLAGLLLILISISFAQLILGRFQREKTIAFTTPSGKVTVALSAVEDLIKRLAGITPEIKELRPDVVAKKNGVVLVDLRVILRSGANIPELTSRLQDITKSEVQQVLGLEQEPVVNVHIVKIVSAEDKERKKKESEKPDSTTIPYSGYGRA